jgi:ABC-type branched-subunit amino acid transport system substrate-binding protein
MDNSIQSVVREIAQELDCGNECYYNTKTNEIIAIPDFSQISDEEEFKEIFREQLEKINQKKENFIKIAIHESFESFKIMEQFIEQLKDQNFKLELQRVLQQKKPFQNFKHKIDQSNFRQSWFDFKQNELEKIVENQLK